MSDTASKSKALTSRTALRRALTPRLSDAAEFSLEQVAALTPDHWTPEARRDAVEVLRGLLEAFATASTYWRVPAVEPRAKSKRKRTVLGGLL